MRYAAAVGRKLDLASKSRMTFNAYTPNPIFLDVAPFASHSFFSIS